MAVLGCDPPLNVGCLVEAGKGNAGSRNLDTGKHRFYANKSGYAKMWNDCLGFFFKRAFDNDQELLEFLPASAKQKPVIQRASIISSSCCCDTLAFKSIL